MEIMKGIKNTGLVVFPNKLEQRVASGLIMEEKYDEKNKSLSKIYALTVRAERGKVQE